MRQTWCTVSDHSQFNCVRNQRMRSTHGADAFRMRADFVNCNGIHQRTMCLTCSHCARVRRCMCNLSWVRRCTIRTASKMPCLVRICACRRAGNGMHYAEQIFAHAKCIELQNFAAFPLRLTSAFQQLEYVRICVYMYIFGNWYREGEEGSGVVQMAELSTENYIKFIYTYIRI